MDRHRRKSKMTWLEGEFPLVRLGHLTSDERLKMEIGFRFRFFDLKWTAYAGIRLRRAGSSCCPSLLNPRLVVGAHFTAASNDYAGPKKIQLLEVTGGEGGGGHGAGLKGKWDFELFQLAWKPRTVAFRTAAKSTFDLCSRRAKSTLYF